MAVQPLPPSRTASVGPPSAGGMNAPPAGTPGGQGPNSQQNLNQIIDHPVHRETLATRGDCLDSRQYPQTSTLLCFSHTSRFDHIMAHLIANVNPQVLEYLSKKGYSRTEAMLRKESRHATFDANQEPLDFADRTKGRQWHESYILVKGWIDDILDIYKPELSRLLWPLFVQCFLQTVTDCFTIEAKRFFEECQKPFGEEHSDDLRALSSINEPEHVQENDIAQLYRTNKYRLTLSKMGFATLIEFLEVKEAEGGKGINYLLNNHIDIHTVDRAAIGGARGLQRLMEEKHGEEQAPAEDEGIPGHHPGSANLSADATGALNRLALGPMPMEADLMEDVKAELGHEDITNPPPPGRSTLTDTFEQRIKSEPVEDTAPSREAIPYPPSTARDVAMEVQKVKENRDRFRIEGKTGGVGPGVSVTMFTFHNTFDSVNCIEFSDDNTLAAVGTAESFIRVWSLDNRALTSPHDPPGFQQSSSRRLIGHSGPVYALSFSPSAAVSEAATNGHTDRTTTSESQPRYMLSCSADTTIRLWSLDTWTNLVVYRSHNSPVWDVRFCPHGHYFVSASADRTARLWSTPQIAPLRLLVGHDSDVETIAWHPNGAYVVTGAGVGDRTVRMWSVASGGQVRIFTGHTGNITALACAPDGHIIASADDKGVIVLWDIRTGRLVKRMRGHGAGGVWSLDWSVESTVLVSGGADNSVRVWDVQPNKETKENKVNGETGGVKVDGVTVHGTGAAAAAAAAAAKTAKGKSREQATPDMISDFKTKKSPVYKVKFTQMNLVVAGGTYLP
ncbi:Transcription initiation factor TFIID subunit 5 [Recurvomyces mirabilis]|uniref:Transcription initiation factor TFIID subunit 5 n=1 Tax=Recurvomyces mirabilis TaxID=574656 RepID=A0AAE0WT33_9PEZI|nr:Transcription initiation factor TFIID subunit 5 [Recurvomyces mirabilis]